MTRLSAFPSRKSVSLSGWSSNSLAFPSVTRSELLLLLNLSQSPVPLGWLSEHLWQPCRANLCLSRCFRCRKQQSAAKSSVTRREKSLKPDPESGSFETISLVRAKVIKQSQGQDCSGQSGWKDKHTDNVQFQRHHLPEPKLLSSSTELRFCSDNHTWK